MMPFAPSQKPLIGISSCLLGEPVRYDGADKRDDYLTTILAMHFDLRPFCPEVAIGLGVPRPRIQLINIAGSIRVRGVQEPDSDFTHALTDIADQQSSGHAALSGYVLKSNSPSCGLDRVNVQNAQGSAVQFSSGAYAVRLRQNFPLLPMEDECRLHEPCWRENFITRVYAYARWQALRASRPSHRFPLP